MYLVAVTCLFFLLVLVAPTALMISVYANWRSRASLQQALHHLICLFLALLKYLMAVSCFLFMVLVSPAALIILASSNIIFWLSGAIHQVLHCDFIPYLLF